jgi:ribonuclease HIII
VSQPDLFPPEKGHIGTDESGKGDYFGPLVVAGVYLPDGQDVVLRELGVKDSKRTSDNRVRELAEVIKAGYQHSVVAIGPERYNDLYAKLHNLNKLLAWAHARVIENILERTRAPMVITDQFGDERFVRDALMKKGRTVELIQKVRAEEDMAVAAASILARAEFLQRLDSLGRDAGLVLPKGSPPAAEAAAAELVRRHGPDILHKVAKLHFKLTERVLAR